MPEEPLDGGGEEEARSTASDFNTAVTHFYRGEIYRSTVWRQRLDATTNWAVVSTAAALSFAFSDPQHSHVIFILTGLLVMILLHVESRRYRVFDVWRQRARLLEECFMVRHLLGAPMDTGHDWRRALATDLTHPRFKMSLAEAVARRLRRNYGAVFLVIYCGWLLKLAAHPDAALSIREIVSRAAIGPLPGGAVFAMGIAHYTLLLCLIAWAGRGRPERGEIGEPSHGLLWRRFEDPEHVYELFEDTLGRSMTVTVPEETSDGPDQ